MDHFFIYSIFIIATYNVMTYTLQGWHIIILCSSRNNISLEMLLRLGSFI